MFRRKSSPVRLLLLVFLLVVGSVHAQTLFVCESMGVVAQDTCCCDDMDNDKMSMTKSDLCCEKTVGLSVDSSSDQTVPATKPVEVRSDVDPPPSILLATDINLPPYRVDSAILSLSTHIPQVNGSRTYLVTQRLRI